ncbi:MAG: hypothetical protein IPF63_11585 [Bacteroidetes bacterium]|nr:hypothetical protein [Bacteroidota bacterium]
MFGFPFMAIILLRKCKSPKIDTLNNVIVSQKKRRRKFKEVEVLKLLEIQKDKRNPLPTPSMEKKL